MTWKPDICIYHFPCDDGFAAAWVVNRKWSDVDFRPCNYGMKAPADGIDNKNILIADFSFKPDTLKAMAERAASVVVLDHHKTAQEDLGEFITDPMRCDVLDTHSFPPTGPLANFDMTRCGSLMTWDFCFPNQPAPMMLRHIDDRDRWIFAYPETRTLSLYIRSFPFEFEAWDEFMIDSGDNRGAILAEAKAIERYYNRRISELCEMAEDKVIGNHVVPVVNAPFAFASDCAHELLTLHPDAPFAATYYESYGGRSYSLRSSDDRVDVSEVARSYGGGGHRNSAGFRHPL